MRALIVVAGVAVSATAADFGGCLHSHAITNFEALHRRADRGDRAAEFVAQHERQLYRPALMIAPHVQVATADTGGADFYHDLPGCGIGRLWDITQLDIFVFASVFDECVHIMCPFGFHRYVNGRATWSPVYLQGSRFWGGG